MSNDGYRRIALGNHLLHTETLMLGYGYDPKLSEGSVKPPVFLTSTFTFPSADAGREFFDIATGRAAGKIDSAGGLVYARYNHPNAQIVEERLALFEHAESGAVFASGMAAIATTAMAHCRPGDVILFSQPLYGGTDALFHHVLPQFGIKAHTIADPASAEGLRAAVREAEAKGRLALIFLETPSNPLTTLSDIAVAAEMADESGKRQGHRPILAVDNTLMGPLFQKPLQCGADLSVYSLTKYVGGHSDLIAGGVLGSRKAMAPLRALRPLLGGSIDPHTCWMLTRSMETVGLRMSRAAENAATIAQWLTTRDGVKSVHFPALAKPGSIQARIYAKQCTGPGTLMSFDVGSRARAFAILDRLKIVKLAVSLGGTESLTCHPSTTVLSGLSEEERLAIGVGQGLIRLSVGIEHADDLIADLDQAFAG
ncbi:MAG: cystathionine gamma-synthase family protein [Alphaproteobacteria bacterium]|nr:cystathionine gamma-synthase family protein [Alphaproteobacteria bacterium]MBU6471372.1 cystathionine gamma-synthase family protein [Alphaproteobacteria bacterium]MDE2014676.1 cystathionine gamma-synthase family protein [Alphaproteobacteria bacterium]MDE2074705.1 cystathionine gamma-synthase family protein [Alphaproteobacteria bacterium]